MNRVAIITALFMCFGVSTLSYADEVKLKKSCLKDHPLVAGESDEALRQIYAEVCNKKNKENKNTYLIQAAQRFEQLGQHTKALQLVESLNASNVQHTALTDVKFLAAVGLAQEALTQIRDTEVRYLSDESYAPAVAFNDAVKKAKPLSVIDQKSDETAKRAESTSTKIVKETRSTTRTTTRAQRPSSSSSRSSTRTTTPARTNNNNATRPASSPAPATPRRENPFGSLN